MATSNIKSLTDPAVARYSGHFADRRDRLPGAGHERIAALRAQAAAIFAENGLPTRRIESWKYTDLRPLTRAEFASASPVDITPDITPEITLGAIAPYLVAGAHVAVFVDGAFAPALSSLDAVPDGVRIVSLAAALDDGDEALCAELGHIADPAQPGLGALNAALMQDGAVCRVGDGVAVDAPIQLIFATTEAFAAEAHLRNLIVVGEQGRATVVQTHVAIGPSAGFCDMVTEVSVGQGATLRHVKRQEESTIAWHIGLTEARLGRDATYDSFVLSTGARLARNEIRVCLDGEGADATLNGIALVRGRQHCDNTTDMDHAKGHCHSSQLYKNVLDDRARAVFQGRIHVAKDAQRTDAHQMNRNLLLSRSAQADSKPELIIHADDVKCSHGATVGDLDRDALFYLRSRGIDAITARSLLVRAFAAEMIEDLPDDAVRTHLEGALASWLDGVGAVEVAA